MDPLTLMLIGTALNVGGGLLASRDQQKADRRNAAIADQNARLTRQQGAQNEAAQRRGASQLFGEQRAAFVQSGIDPSSGSALDVQDQSAAFSELDAMTIRYEHEMRALGLLSDAQQYRQDAKDTQRAGYLNAGAGLLSGMGEYGARRQARVA